MNYLEIFGRIIRVVHKVLSSGGGIICFVFFLVPQGVSLQGF